MSENLYLVSLLVIAGTTLLVFAMRTLAARQESRARIVAQSAWEALAARAAAAQAETAVHLAPIQPELAAIARRLAAIETLLSQVG